MTHYFEKNIVEIKNEYTDFLTNMMAPLIYEGIQSLYYLAKKRHNSQQIAAQQNPNQEIEPIIRIFKNILKSVPTISNANIEREMVRIRDNSKNADIFDNLVRACFKSFIVLLTYNSSGKKCKLVNERLHETIDIKLFIHKCYIECAKQFYNYPEIFIDDYSSLELQRNERDAIEIIKKSIIEGIRKSLPMKQIIEEYLIHDYIVEHDTDESKLAKIKRMLDAEKYNVFDNSSNNKQNAFDDNSFNNTNNVIAKNINFKAIDSDSDSDSDSNSNSNSNSNDNLSDGNKNNLDKLEESVHDLSKLIFEREKTTDDIKIDKPLSHPKSEYNKTEIKSEIKKEINEQNDNKIENSDDELKKKISSGEYITDLNNLKNKKPMKIKQYNNKEDINIVKDKIGDEKNIGTTREDREAYFGAVLNK
jgi:hypothetical protein